MPERCFYEPILGAVVSKRAHEALEKLSNQEIQDILGSKLSFAGLACQYGIGETEIREIKAKQV